MRFEAYDNQLVLVGVWHFDIKFDFLPSYRFAKIFRFLPTPMCPSSILCQNNGTCHVTNNNSTLFVCACTTNWTGDRCEVPSLNHCSPLALSRGPICVCTSGFIPPHCHVRIRVCEQHLNPCSNNGTCYPYPVIGKFTCTCAPGFHGIRCEHALTSVLILTNHTLRDPLLIQIFAVRFGYTLLLNQLFTRTLPVHVDFDGEGFLMKITLVHLFLRNDDHVETQLLLLDKNCSNVSPNRAVLLETAVVCTNRQDWNVDARQFHSYCQEYGNATPCFYDSSYLCRCIGERSECIVYHRDAGQCTRDNVCLNGGVCVQTDPRNNRDITCVCPACTSGI